MLARDLPLWLHSFGAGALPLVREIVAHAMQSTEEEEEEEVLEQLARSAGVLLCVQARHGTVSRGGQDGRLRCSCCQAGGRLGALSAASAAADVTNKSTRKTRRRSSKRTSSSSSPSSSSTAKRKRLAQQDVEYLTKLVGHPSPRQGDYQLGQLLV